MTVTCVDRIVHLYLYKNVNVKILDDFSNIDCHVIVM